jgi:hypothetical protein
MVVGGAVEVSVICGGASDETVGVDGVVCAVVDEVVVGNGVNFDGALPWPPLSRVTSKIAMTASASTPITTTVETWRYHGVAECGSGSGWPESNNPVGSSLGSPPGSLKPKRPVGSSLGSPGGPYRVTAQMVRLAQNRRA